MKKKYLLIVITVVVAISAAFAKNALATYFTDEYYNLVSIEYFESCPNINTPLCAIKWVNGNPVEYRYYD